MAPQKYHGFVDNYIFNACSYARVFILKSFMVLHDSCLLAQSLVVFPCVFSKIRLCSIWSWSLCHHLPLSSMPDGAFSIPQSTTVSTWYTASSCHPGLIFGHRVETELRLPCMAGRQRLCPSRKKKTSRPMPRVAFTIGVKNSWCNKNKNVLLIGMGNQNSCGECFIYLVGKNINQPLE